MGIGVVKVQNFHGVYTQIGFCINCIRTKYFLISLEKHKVSNVKLLTLCFYKTANYVLLTLTYLLPISLDPNSLLNGCDLAVYA